MRERVSDEKLTVNGRSGFFEIIQTWFLLVKKLVHHFGRLLDRHIARQAHRFAVPLHFKGVLYDDLIGYVFGWSRKEELLSSERAFAFCPNMA